MTLTFTFQLTVIRIVLNVSFHRAALWKAHANQRGNRLTYHETMTMKHIIHNTLPNTESKQ